MNTELEPELKVDLNLKLITTKQNRKTYMNNYNKIRKDNEYFILMKRLNNKLSYLRKHNGLTDDNEQYKIWKSLYPEFVNITEILKNINIINSNKPNMSLKDRLHALIDEIIQP